jgi:hypothetical protein
VNLTVYLPKNILDGWVRGNKIIFEDVHVRPIQIEPGESALEALNRVFGKVLVEVF